MGLVEADKLVPDALVEARQKADVPTVLLRGYIGEVGETIKLFPRRDQDSWTEIEAADILGAVQSSGGSKYTLVVRRDAKVLYASAGRLSDAAPVEATCHDQWTDEEKCENGTLYVKVIRICVVGTRGGFPSGHHLITTRRERWVAIGSCDWGDDSGGFGPTL